MPKLYVHKYNPKMVYGFKTFFSLKKPTLAYKNASAVIAIAVHPGSSPMMRS
jgi:hypothetical protein